MGHQDVSSLLQQTSKELALGDHSLSLQDLEIDLLEDSPLSEVHQWMNDAWHWWQQASPEERKFIALVKALVIAADLAGSALPRSGFSAVDWVKEVLSRTCSKGNMERLAIQRLKGRTLRFFQSAVANSPSRVTLVRAGCGTGKTTAAYLWASRHEGRKLFFCYPTTGTATEGYADYVLPDNVEAALIHSRSEVDLEDLRGAPDYEGDFQTRLEALVSWDVPLIVCTVDTVLGLVQNNRRGLFSFPAIANGAFVFDEVHAYDDRMFGSLLRFLDAFRGVPVLLMTASLPKERFEMLKKLTAGLGEPLGEIEGPSELETIARYELRPGSLEDVWTRIHQLLTQGGKILWVTNTVDRAVAFFQEACRRGFKPVEVYHSRYRYCDRMAKHCAVIEGFHYNTEPILAITTQVCEVSLDLSADLLVTDLAPVPSLIQRLGRLNRYVTPEASAEPKTAIVLEPGSALPYDEQEIAAARRWLDTVCDRPVSQADLAQAFLRSCSSREAQGEVSSAWLDGGPFSTTAPLREPGATIPVIRYEDKEAAQANRKQVVRLSIPMLLGPVAKEVESWPRLGVARVAPQGRIEYSEEWGAAWQK
ncbi:CRISPR-associated nuclease/helicase Cas3 [Nitrospira moscoviensis]|uniref:CRISPR-associated nuclease/helicase Cas3 n=2 Tax=Nitrospira moscoviensis TaxID=42253 RepID=A0A0K2GAG7_NITMO|nr:CRISPR-associated nuclease/helicase Cas3 [Nitrospira moscoviensis]